MKVVIFLGSISDKSIMKNAIKVLNTFNITYKCYIISAHRLPDTLSETIIKIEKEKTDIIIAGAGLSAHLPGIISSKTIIPVIGVPIFNPSSINNFMGGIDALSSITQMPNGVPVAAVGINNSYNAALLSVHMLSIKYVELKKSLEKFRDYNRKKLKSKIEQIL